MKKFFKKRWIALLLVLILVISRLDLFVKANEDATNPTEMMYVEEPVVATPSIEEVQEGEVAVAPSSSGVTVETTTSPTANSPIVEGSNPSIPITASDTTSNGTSSVAKTPESSKDSETIPQSTTMTASAKTEGTETTSLANPKAYGINTEINLSFGLGDPLTIIAIDSPFTAYVGFSAIDTGGAADFTNFTITMPLPSYISSVKDIRGYGFSQGVLLTDMFMVTQVGNDLILKLRNPASIVVGDNYLLPIKLAFTEIVDPDLGNCDPTLLYTPTGTGVGDFVNSVTATSTKSINNAKKDLYHSLYTESSLMVAGNKRLISSNVSANYNIVGQKLRYTIDLVQTKEALIFGDIAAEFTDTRNLFQVDSVTYNATRTQAVVDLIRVDNNRKLLYFGFANSNRLYFPVVSKTFSPATAGEIVLVTVTAKAEPIDPGKDMSCRIWSSTNSASIRVSNEFVWPTGYFRKSGTAVSMKTYDPISGWKEYPGKTPGIEYYYDLNLFVTAEPFYKNLDTNFTLMQFDDNPLEEDSDYFDKSTWTKIRLRLDLYKSEPAATPLEYDNILLKLEYTTTDNPTLRAHPDVNNKTLQELRANYGTGDKEFDLAPLVTGTNKVTRLVVTYSTVNGGPITPGYTVHGVFGPRIYVIFDEATEGDYQNTNRGKFYGESIYGTSTGIFDVPSYVYPLKYTVQGTLQISFGDNLFAVNETKNLRTNFGFDRYVDKVSQKGYSGRPYILVPDFFTLTSSNYSDTGMTIVIDGIVYKIYHRPIQQFSPEKLEMIISDFSIKYKGGSRVSSAKIYHMLTTIDFENQLLDLNPPDLLAGFSHIYQPEVNFNSASQSTGLTYLPNTFGIGDASKNAFVLAQSVEVRFIEGRKVNSEKAIIHRDNRILRSNRVLAGETFDYRLRVENVSALPINYLRVADVLPFVGDTQLLNGLPRNSEIGMEFVSVQSMSPGVTVKYMDTINYATINNDINNLSTPLTTTFNPSAAGASVKGLFFEFNGTLSGAQAIEIVIRVKAPTGTAVDKLAINDFAYSGTFTSGQAVQPAQPAKVYTLLSPMTDVSLDKTIVQVDPYDLAEEVQWNIPISLGNDVMNQTSIVLKDKVDNVFNIKSGSIKLLDGSGVDVSNLVTFTVINNEINVIFKPLDPADPNKEFGSNIFYHLVDKDFTLTYITTLKTIISRDDLLTTHGVAANNTITIPNKVELYYTNELIISAEAEAEYLLGGLSLTKIFENSIDLNKVSNFELYEDIDGDGSLDTAVDRLVETKSTLNLALSFNFLEVKTYFVKEIATEAGYLLADPIKIELTQGATTRQKNISITNVMDPIDPNVIKSADKTAVTKFNEDIVWNIDFDFGNVANRWDRAVLLDQVDALLVIDENSITLKDELDNSVLDRGTLTVVDNQIKIVLDKDTTTSDFGYLNNKIYTLSFIAKVHPEVDLNILATEGKIINSALLEYGDLNELISNEVEVTLPEIEEPKVEKDVVTTSGDPDKKLAFFLEPATWTVSYSMGNYASLWNRAVLEDQVLDFLIIDPASVDVLDHTDASVLALGNLTIVDNLITFEFAADPVTNDYAYLENNTYRLVFTTNINKEVDMGKLEDYLTINQGLLNDGNLKFGNNWQQINNLGEITSNVVKIIPPFVHPEVRKSVVTNSGDVNGILKQTTEAATWTVEYAMGSYTSVWTRATIKDQVHPWILIDSDSVDILDETNTSVKNLGTLTITDNLIEFVFHPDSVSSDYTYLANKTYRLIFTGKIDGAMDPQVLNDFFVLNGGIPNTGDLLFGNQWMQDNLVGSITSNEVKIAPPGFESPIVTKSVETASGDKQGNLAYTTEKATWKVAYSMGSSADLWKWAVLEDQVNKYLVIDKNSVDVLDKDNHSVLHKGELLMDKNFIKFSFLPDATSKDFSYLVGQTYTLIFTTTISNEANWEELQTYLKDNKGIWNSGDLFYGNDWFTQQKKDRVTSNKVKITPPNPQNPIVSKVMIDDSGKNLPHPATLKDPKETVKYVITYKLGNYMDFLAKAILEDDIDKQLIIDQGSIEVKDEAGKSILTDGMLTVKDNRIEFAWDKKDGSFQHLNNQTITMEFVARFDPTLTSFRPINNVAVLKSMTKALGEAITKEEKSNLVSVTVKVVAKNITPTPTPTPTPTANNTPSNSTASRTGGGTAGKTGMVTNYNYIIGGWGLVFLSLILILRVKKRYFKQT